jgi:hypothetical protein
VYCRWIVAPAKDSNITDGKLVLKPENYGRLNV